MTGNMGVAVVEEVHEGDIFGYRACQRVHEGQMEAVNPTPMGS